MLLAAPADLSIWQREGKEEALLFIMQSTATYTKYDMCDKVSFIICFAQMLI